MIRYLTEFGWFEGRRIDTAPYQRKCEEAGHQWNAAAEDFLVEFGGLRFPVPYTAKEHIGPYSPMLDFTISFIPGFGHYGTDIRTGKIMTIEDFEGLLYTKLCPIGNYNFGWNILFAGYDCFYYTFLESGEVIKLGNTGNDVFRSYLAGIIGEEIL